MVDNVQAQQETLTIDELSRKIQDANTELQELKNLLDDLSIEEKSNRLEDLENTILLCSQDLEDLETDSSASVDREELSRLKSQVDVLKQEKDNLQRQISNQATAEMSELAETVEVGGGESLSSGNSEKGGVKEWLGKQREGLTSKQEWKDNTGKNILRALGGVGIVAGIWKLGERIFGGKSKENTGTAATGKSKRELRRERREQRRRERTERRANRPWWQKFLIGSAVAGGTVIGGVQVYKHRNQIKSWVKERLGLALSFDEAKQKVEDEVRNGKNDADHFGAFNSNFEDGITFDEQTQEICSYDQKTKIDKKNKKLEGLDVGFSSYEELIHAANIVNFAKRKLRGRGSTARPFGQTERGGDISFNCSASGKQEFLSANNSNEWSWILGTIGVAGGGILGGYCAGVKGAAIGGLSGGLGGYALGSYVDNTSAAGRCCGTISRGKNFDLFVLYLNDQKDENGKSLWEAIGEQHMDPDGSPINGLVDNGETESIGKREGILADIEKEYGEDQTGRRNLNILWEESKPTEYIIESFGHSVRLTIEGGPTKKGDEIDYSKITKIHIEKYNDTDWGNGLDIDFPKTKEGLEEAIRTANLTNMFREDWAGKGREDYSFSCGRFIGLDGKSLYFDAGEFYGKGTRLLDRKTFREKYPTIFKDVTKENVILSSHQKEYHEQAINDESTGSQYIKYLHQMGQGRFWKKI